MTDSSPTTGIAHVPYGPCNPPPLAFHEWAELSAQTAQRSTAERHEIYQRWGVKAPLFEACNSFWLEELHKQIMRNNFRMARIYADMCVREMRARQAQSSTGGAATSTEQPVAIEDIDGTAILVALPDHTALPFRAPTIAEPPPLLAPANPPERPARKSGEETKIAPALQLDVDALPFRKPDGSNRE